LRITTGVEFGGLKAPPNLQVISKLMPSVKRALPTYDPQPRSTWLGFRPSVPDSLPFIGQSNKTPNAYLAFGHGHLGLTLGPLTGQLLARQISGEPAAIDLAPFRVDRFEKPRHRVLAKPSS
jgi:D-amino-acid dehydrogenase